jgi:SAM-dependent methyltransferase
MNPTSAFESSGGEPHRIGKIEQYRSQLQRGHELRVIFGDHWSNHPGWLVLNESDQDVTRPLAFEDACIDVIFTEHVLEHLGLADALSFLGECRRVLKSHGTLRVVCPMLEKLLTVDLRTTDARIYVESSLAPFFGQELEELRTLGLDGLLEAPRVFLLNSLFRLHGHKFIWSSELLAKTIRAVGFSHALQFDVGLGSRLEYCIERRCRGVYTGSNWQEDVALGRTFDPESLAVEGIK